MASTIKVDKIEGSTGSTITVPTGQTLTLTDGLAIGSLPTITVAKGGTNLTSFAAGDLLYATGSTTLAKLPKGTAAQTLKMNSGATAPEWTTVAAASQDVTKLATLNATSGATFDVNGYFTSDYKFYRLYFRGITSSGTGSKIYARVLVGGSVDSGSSYATVAARTYTDPTPSNQESYYGDSDSTTEWLFYSGDKITDAAIEGGACGHVDIFDPLSTSKYKTILWHYGAWCQNTEFQKQEGFGIYRNVNAISGFQIYIDNSNTFANIDVSLYGYKN